MFRDGVEESSGQILTVLVLIQLQMEPFHGWHPFFSGIVDTYRVFLRLITPLVLELSYKIWQTTTDRFIG